MLSKDTLKEFTRKFQTTEINVIREYIQHLLLSYLYRLPESEKLLFKGGTALRIIYGSPRFSEDLDFSGEKINYELIEGLLVDVLTETEREGININLKEAKSTSGGYLGIFYYELFDFKGNINFEISLRKKESSKEVITIVNDYLPAYTLTILSGKEIVEEKIKALIFRRKPRDYYDLYFILRHPVLNKCTTKKNLKQIKEYLLEEDINFKRELSNLLPVNHHQILKNFKKSLLFEIEKFL